MSIFSRNPETATPGRRRALPLLRLALSILLLAALIWSIDGRDLARRFTTLHWPWVAAALALSLPQQLLHAWRWHFTAKRLGAALTYRRALADYYLASFVNQVLPAASPAMPGAPGAMAGGWKRRMAAGSAAPCGP